MARIRSIKPELFTDSKTGTLPPDALKLMLGLLVHADDYGVIRYDLDEFRVLIYPYESDTITAVGEPLCLLLERRLVRWFSVDDTPYLWVTHFLRHQRVSHPGKPLLEGWENAPSIDQYHAAQPHDEPPPDLPDPPRTRPKRPEPSRVVQSPPEDSREFIGEEPADMQDNREPSRAVENPPEPSRFLPPELKGKERERSTGLTTFAPAANGGEVVQLRPDRALFQALCNGTGIADWRTISPRERGKLNTAVGELLEMEATPEQVLAACEAWRRHFPGATCTATAVIGHWGKLQSPVQPRGERLRYGRGLTAQQMWDKADEGGSA